jgi:CDP-diacylglycerol--serine O-phosphatidyltransferase
MNNRTPRKPFSMIREFHLSDWFTLGNAVCGTAALFSMITYVQSNNVGHIYFACSLVFGALIFDILDGRIARWRQNASAMGRELDSLADVISFGVAPAIIGYGCGMQGLYDRVVLAYFVGQGEVLRRNADTDVFHSGLHPYRRGLAWRSWRSTVVRQDIGLGTCVSPPHDHICRVWLAHDQPHSHTETMSRTN